MYRPHPAREHGLDVFGHSATRHLRCGVFTSAALAEGPERNHQESYSFPVVAASRGAVTAAGNEFLTALKSKSYIIFP